MPFFTINNNELGLTLEGKDNSLLGDFTDSAPCFTIQSLLDKIPGELTIQAFDPFAESTNSQYYTASEFLTAKIPTKFFSIFHLNIASLGCHIDDLKLLLNLLNHPFDVIGVSETKIRANIEPLTNIDIEGYTFVNTPTETFFGSTGIYTKNEYSAQKRNDLSFSVNSIGESVFVEILTKSNKKLLIGCLYRHHTKISLFTSNFLEEIMKIIHLEKKRQFA